MEAMVTMEIMLKGATLMPLHGITLGEVVEGLLDLSYLSSWKDNRLEIRDNKNKVKGLLII